MIMVILGHSYMVPASVSRVIFSVHMPLFFILSGYCFRVRKEESFGAFMKKNARTLLLPYVLTSAVIILLKMLIAVILHIDAAAQAKLWGLSALYGSGARIPDVWQDFIQPIGVIWFLLAMFIGRTLLRWILHSRVPWLWAAIFFFASYISTDYFWLPFSLQPGFCSVLFLYLGYAIRQGDMFDRKKVRFPVRVAAAAVWVYCMIHCGILWMVENYYQNQILDLIGAVCGTYTIVYISQLIEAYIGFLRKPLSFLGRISLGVMCAHLITLICWMRGYVIDWMQGLTDWPSWLCDFIDIAVLSAVITLIMYYLPVFRRIMFPSVHKKRTSV